MFERTYIMLKPDALQRGLTGRILARIEEKGYRKLLVERDGKPTIIDNPNWK